MLSFSRKIEYLSNSALKSLKEFYPFVSEAVRKGKCKIEDLMETLNTLESLKEDFEGKHFLYLPGPRDEETEMDEEYVETITGYDLILNEILENIEGHVGSIVTDSILEETLSSRSSVSSESAEFADGLCPNKLLTISLIFGALC